MSAADEEISEAPAGAEEPDGLPVLVKLGNIVDVEAGAERSWTMVKLFQ